MNRKALLFLCLISLIFFEPFVSINVQALGEAIFVSADGGGTSCTQAAPCSVAQGMANASDGDSLYFKRGTYTGTTDWILSITKGISLYGGWDGAPTGMVNLDSEAFVTTIDGKNVRRAMSINYTSDVYPILITGFNFINGRIDSGSGGAINVYNGNVAIEGNQFVDNFAGYYGGAIYTRSTFDVTIRKNTFTSNRTINGGGAIFVGNSLPGVPSIIIEDNQFISNESAYGDAIHSDSMPVVFTRNFIKNSPGASAINISSAGGDPSMISNNVILNSLRAVNVDNTSTGKHQVWNNTIVSSGYAISGASSSKIDVVNNIIVQSYHSISLGIGEISGRNNLFYENTYNTVPLDNPVTDQDPLFVNPANDDYHLQKGSPAIDAGADVDLLFDFDGDTRPFGSGYDIGADEFISALYLLFLPLILR